MESDLSGGGPPSKRVKLSSVDSVDIPLDLLEDLPDELGTGVGDNVTIGDSSPVQQNGHFGYMLQSPEGAASDHTSQYIGSPPSVGGSSSLSQLLMHQSDVQPFVNTNSVSPSMISAQPQQTLHSVGGSASKSQLSPGVVPGNAFNVLNSGIQNQVANRAVLNSGLLSSSITVLTSPSGNSSSGGAANQMGALTRVGLKLPNGQTALNNNNNAMYVLSQDGILQPLGQQQQQQQAVNANLQNAALMQTLGNSTNHSGDIVFSSCNSQLPGRNLSQELLQLQQPQLVLQSTNQIISSPAADPEKRRLIQQQLVLLLHAHKCRRRQINGDMVCNVPHCQTMKVVLGHMASCTAGKNCQVPHCSSSRQIIWHWKTCNKSDCPVCSPLKSAAADRRSALVRQVQPDASLPEDFHSPGFGGSSSSTVRPSQVISARNQLAQLLPDMSPLDQHLQLDQSPASAGSDQQLTPGAITARLQGHVPESYDSQGLTALPSNQLAKQWQQSVNQDLRNHLVRRLVQAIYTAPDPAALKDRRVQNLIEYARKVESDMYESANTREEYYRMLAEKIYKIRKEMEEKIKRHQQDKVTQALGDGHTFPGSSSQSEDQKPGTLHGMSTDNVTTPEACGANDGSQGHSSLLSGLLSTSNDDTPTPLGEDRIALADALDQLVNQPDGEDGNTDSADVKPEIKVKIEGGGEGEQGGSSGSDGSQQQPLDDKTQALDVKAVVPVGSMFSATPAPTPPARPQFKKVWKPNELRHVLIPTLERLYRLPEAQPFRVPVDPIALGIPDYFDIIKRPMDLQTIKRKLDTGQYEEPWDYIDDIWLMIDNAQIYNKRSSRVYKAAQKLADQFVADIDGAMRQLGYCCGQRLDFLPQPLCCFSKNLCTIARDAVYYCHQDRYVYCEKCYNEVVGDEIEIIEDPLQPPLVFKKDVFQWKKNNEVTPELFAYCVECGRRNHQICAMYIESLNPSGYMCNICLNAKGLKKKELRFVAKRLPHSKLGAYLENRVNTFLRKKDSGAGDVVIRVLSSTDKVTEIKPGMKARFADEMAENFPYRAKTLFAYEEIDGVDVCFFGMHVQEYGSDCPQPNARRVYVAYLDSVHYFRPKEYRTAVYHEILIGYLDYAKTLGYCTAHIWACPPSEGDDYIFHCHPPDQRVPKPKRLQDWYRKMLDKAVVEGVVIDYKDVLKDAIECELNQVTQLPYFDGDFWPNVLEDCVKEEQEEADRRQQLDVDAAMIDVDEVEIETTDVGEAKKKGPKKKSTKNNKLAGNKRKAGLGQAGGDLVSKMYTLMEKHKEVFFVVRLSRPSPYMPPTRDPDPVVQCDLMDGRDSFLSMARDKHWEFSTLRRAKYSTMAMVYELHTQGANGGFVYTCNVCKAHVETRWHCTTCVDYDLCVSCYEKHPHTHTMEKLGFDMDAEAAGERQQDPQEARRLSVQKCIQSLVHACQCRDANCRLPNCQKMRRVVMHARGCQLKMNGGCPSCKQLIMLCCYHAKHCSEPKCPVPFCANIKNKLRQQQYDNRLREANMMRRRVAQMTGLAAHGGGGGSSSVMHHHQQQHQQQARVAAIGNIGGASGQPPVRAVQAAQQAQLAAIRQASSSQLQTMAASNPSLSLQQQPNAASRWPPSYQQAVVGQGQGQGSNSGTGSLVINSQQLQGNSQLGANTASSSSAVQVGAGQAGAVGGVTLQPAVLQRLIQALKSPQSPQQQQTLELIRRNPQLMAALIKQSQLKKQQQQQQQQQLGLTTGVQQTSADSLGGIQLIAAGGAQQQIGGQVQGRLQQQQQQIRGQGIQQQVIRGQGQGIGVQQQVRGQIQGQQQIRGIQQQVRGQGQIQVRGQGQVMAGGGRQLGLNTMQAPVSQQQQQQHLLVIPQQRATQQAVSVVGNSGVQSTQLLIQQQQLQRPQSQAGMRQQIRPGVVMTRPPMVATAAGIGGVLGGGAAAVRSASNTVLVPVSLSGSGQSFLLRMPSSSATVDTNSMRVHVQPSGLQQQQVASNTALAVASNNAYSSAAMSSNGLSLTGDDIMPLTPQEQLSKYVDNL